MSEMSFEQMLEESFKTIRNGEVVEGTVIDVKPDEIVLNIGYKSDGIITRNEYTNESNADLTTMVSVGDTMEAKVLKVNDGEGQVLLTYKRLAAEKGSKRLEEAFENKEVLTAKVSQVLDGGLCVVVDETRVFIPASLVSDSYEKDLSKYKDQEIQFVISEFNPKRRRIIGDRKQLLVEKKLEQQKELFAKIKVGDVMEGTVKNVTDFGAFIDLGGADGLLHISEMSWGRVESPKKVFNVGDTVKVFIKDINDTKIALSMKFPSENPWNGAAEKFAVGNIVKGKVARMTDFGAFVELAPGVDALLHVSQISKDHVEKPADVLKIGQEIEAKVVDFNEDDKKLLKFIQRNNMLDNYEKFKKDVYALTKIDLNCYKEKQMRRRIDTLINKNGITSYDAYVDLIKKDKEKFEQFVNFLTINVSEFYRNPEQWKILEGEVFPKLIKTYGKNLKVWSAACSTGDEPYSLVMALSRQIPLANIKVIATDIDKQVLDKARMGLYNEKSIANVPKDLKDKYFKKIGTSYQISDEIKRRVEFKEHNLLKDPYPTGCNLIVCRNVVIYFTEEAKDEIYKKFNQCMTKGGVLFIGSTEQIMNYKELGFVRDKSFFFEKE